MVIIPWRGGCPHRDAALGWVLARYEHGGWTVKVAEHGPGPWSKASVVMPAIEETDDPIVVVADADVWCDGLQLAVDAVTGGAPWGIPHRRVKRLNQRSTLRVLGGEPPDRLPLEEPPYGGAAGGGLVVLPRATALDIPMDPRFHGWGAEDRSWGRALTLLAGQPWRGDVNCFHLWHPPQDRADRNHGSAESEALRQRYIAARQDPVRMRALVEEFRGKEEGTQARGQGVARGRC